MGKSRGLGQVWRVAWKASLGDRFYPRHQETIKVGVGEVVVEGRGEGLQPHPLWLHANLDIFF